MIIRNDETPINTLLTILYLKKIIFKAVAQWAMKVMIISCFKIGIWKILKFQFRPMLKPRFFVFRIKPTK